LPNVWREAIMTPKRVLSVDLACSIDGLGLCSLERTESGLKVDFPKASSLKLPEPLTSDALADAIWRWCNDRGVAAVILDGPQGWKDPSSSLQHCRKCESILNTPAKTGTVGNVIPANWTKLVKFSIAVFATLAECGGQVAEAAELRLEPAKLLVLESFPAAAWKSLELPQLPAKRKCRPGHMESAVTRLQDLYNFRCHERPTHDELQALVAGLAADAVVNDDRDGFRLDGAPAFHQDGHILEGLIVNPTKTRE
jgi:hypothetical protein